MVSENCLEVWKKTHPLGLGAESQDGIKKKIISQKKNWNKEAQ